MWTWPKNAGNAIPGTTILKPVSGRMLSDPFEGSHSRQSVSEPASLNSVSVSGFWVEEGACLQSMTLINGI